MSQMINGMFFGELYPTKVMAGCIELFENAWPNPLETIASVEKECGDANSGLFWQKATVFNNDAKQRTNYNLGITKSANELNNQVAQNVHNQMYALLMAATVPYARKHNIMQLSHGEGYNMLKYSAGQEYKAHYDGSTASARSVSVIVYLNDDYEGGELEFVNFGIKIKPPAGSLFIFPSNYPYAHIAHPVTEGTKYALVTWLHDRDL
jgi:predicted 2-oxoglutarate/Fe(II)-dependent dioxygenase YbiX